MWKSIAFVCITAALFTVSSAFQLEAEDRHEIKDFWMSNIFNTSWLACDPLTGVGIAVLGFFSGIIALVALQVIGFSIYYGITMYLKVSPLQAGQSRSADFVPPRFVRPTIRGQDQHPEWDRQAKRRHFATHSKAADRSDVIGALNKEPIPE